MSVWSWFLELTCGTVERFSSPSDGSIFTSIKPRSKHRFRRVQTHSTLGFCGHAAMIWEETIEPHALQNHFCLSISRHSKFTLRLDLQCNSYTTVLSETGKHKSAFQHLKTLKCLFFFHLQRNYRKGSCMHEFQFQHFTSLTWKTLRGNFRESYTYPHVLIFEGWGRGGKAG